MSLRLRYLAETTVPVEVEGLTPDWAASRSLDQIRRFEIFHGNRKTPLAEMFEVTGDPTDLRFDIEGNIAGVHWLGAHMTAGEVVIHGPAGRHVGSQMSGGSITVEGDAQGWVGSEMRGGTIHVRGNAGHLVGAAYRGSAKGMTGGVILVDGNAGNEIGHTMRRGLIAVGGDAGDMIGFNMIAGTVLVFGEPGIRAGAGMRRGTIGLLGRKVPPLLPTFRHTGTHDLQVFRLMLRDLRSRGFHVDDGMLDAEVDIYRGDLVTIGRGEILKRHAA
jgi:formylmethanofuran dehydrogenase subunit C